MILLYLILAHLLADFVFQPNSLIRWKQRNWKGVFAHAFIHYVTSLLLLLPFLSKPQFPVVITIIALSHFLVDSLKIRLEKGRQRFVKIFLADQEMHLLIILLAAFVLEEFGGASANEEQMPIYSNMGLIAYYIFSILITFAYSILKFQFRRQKTPQLDMKFDYKEMMIRLVGFSLVYFFLLINL